MRLPALTVLVSLLLAQVTYGSVSVTALEAGTASQSVTVAPGGSFSIDVLVTEAGEASGISGVQLTLNASGPTVGAISLAGPADAGNSSAAINNAEWDADISATGTGLPLALGDFPIANLGSGYVANGGKLSGVVTPTSRLATLQCQVSPTAADGTYQVDVSGLAFPDYVGINIGDIPVSPGAALTVNVGSPVLCETAVVARGLFYKGAGFASYATAPNGKTPLVTPGSRGTFANVCTVLKGLNRVYVDIQKGPECPASLPLTVADFTFKVGNHNTASAWATAAAAPAPTSVTVVPNGGGANIDRILIDWPDAGTPGALPNKNWLQVTVAANANTGLASADVHYWGVLIGDVGTGNTVNSAFVTGTDYNTVFNNPSSTLPRVDINSPYDLNKDGFVTGTDWNGSFNNAGSPTPTLPYIVAP